MALQRHTTSTRRVYSESAQSFLASIGSTISSSFEAPLDQAILAEFAATTRPLHGRVVDAGCGPGRVTRFLADAGLDVLGVDIAPGMIAAARDAHAHLEFQEAELTGLPAGDATLAGVAYWYSIITTPPAKLAAVWSELGRVLAPGGSALIAFQSGAGESVARPRAYGTDIDLTLYRHDVDHVCETLEQALLSVQSVTEREPVFDHESTRQAFVIAAATPPT